ncbi:MAG: CBS domain-containing protein [Acidobacteria bacterium]|nr:MAG: CBS domain-containing protein [Acidobacteriota bacterium]
MGEFRVQPLRTAADRRRCTEAVLRDLDALEQMLELGMIEDRRMHCGMEQEMFLVQEDGRPAAVGPELLELIDDPRLVSELARFNLEANLDPQPLGAGFLEGFESQLRELLRIADTAARELGARVLLVGSLPSLEPADLDRANMSPEPRYAALDAALLEERGSALRLSIHGWDRYEATHDSVMPEAANTSLQLHLQVAPDDFARAYNWAQTLSAPLLAAATNSPFFCGRRLWHESRVAIFENATDGRSRDERARGLEPRVGLGGAWLRGGVVELLRQQVARYRPLLWRDDFEDPFAALEAGRAPRLEALMLHGGTLWKWNRACYGAAGERPHLRVENRVLPAGPSVVDEMANVAFFFGLMGWAMSSGLCPSAGLEFDDLRHDFARVAREGLDARLHWLDDASGATWRACPADELIVDELIPRAHQGLEGHAVPASTRERLLGVLEERVRSKRTGSVWLLRTASELRGRGRDALLEATRRMQEHQDGGEPVHRWPIGAEREPVDGATPAAATSDLRVRDVMVRDVFTMRSGDAVSLAAALMKWQHIRHVPVIDDAGAVHGTMTARALLAAEQARRDPDAAPPSVDDVMEAAPPEISPDASLLDATERLLDAACGCLVVRRPGGPLLGIVTERDFLPALRALLNERS